MLTKVRGASGFIAVSWAQGGIDEDLELLFVGCLPVEIEFQEQEVIQARSKLHAVSSAVCYLCCGSLPLMHAC